jgi:hypothetical protein
MQKNTRLVRFYFLLVFLLLILDTPKAQRVFSAEEAQEDITVLYNSFRKVHPGLYRYQDTLVFEQMYNKIKVSFKGEVSYEELFKKSTLLNAAVRDFHTGIQHSKSWTKEHKKVLPFVLRKVENHFYVQYNASDDTTFVRGLEVLEINGEPIASLVEKLKPFIGTDNGEPTSKEYYAVKSFHTYYPRYWDVGDSVRVSVRFADRTTTVDYCLKTMERKELSKTIIKRYPAKKRVNLAYTLEDSIAKIGRLDIHSFVYKGSGADIFQFKFNRTLKQRFKQIKQDSVQHLALDFRANGGGYIPNVGRLMKYVSRESFKMTDTMGFSRKAYFKIFPFYELVTPLAASFFFNKKDENYRFRSFSKKPNKKISKKRGFDGQLYVFSDAGSYSATVFAMVLLNTMNRATFIGAQPGGTTWGSHAGSWYLKKLPNSKVRVRIPEFRIVHSQWAKKEHNLFLQPDYPVEERRNNFFKDEDVYLLKLKELVAK